MLGVALALPVLAPAFPVTFVAKIEHLKRSGEQARIGSVPVLFRLIITLGQWSQEHGPYAHLLGTRTVGGGGAHRARQVVGARFYRGNQQAENLFYA